MHARRAGDERLAADVAVYFGFAAVIGPLPVAEGRRFITRTVEEMLEDTSSKGTLLLTAAVLAAMAADFDGRCAEALASATEADGRSADAATAAPRRSSSTRRRGTPRRGARQRSMRGTYSVDEGVIASASPAARFSR